MSSLNQSLTIEALQNQFNDWPAQRGKLDLSICMEEGGCDWLEADYVILAATPIKATREYLYK